MTETLNNSFSLPVNIFWQCDDYNHTMNYELCTMNSLTLCPIDTAPIDFSMLTSKEVEWLNQYHKRVRETLLPHLSDEADKQWLIEATKEISC